MCLPFCCSGDDHAQGGAETATHDRSDHTGSNGAAHGDTKNGDPMVPRGNNPAPTSPPPEDGDHPDAISPTPAPAKQSPPPALHPPDEGRNQNKIASPPPAPDRRGQKVVSPASPAKLPEGKGQTFAAPTPALNADDDKLMEHAASGPNHHGPVVASKPKETTDTIRIPPMQQVVHRADQDDDNGYPATAPVPAANNRGDGHGYGDKDDRKTPGKSRR